MTFLHLTIGMKKTVNMTTEMHRKLPLRCEKSKKNYEEELPRSLPRHLSPHPTLHLIPQFTLLQKIAPRMYQNAPFSVQKSTHPPPSAPSAPRSSRLWRSTSAPAPRYSRLRRSPRRLRRIDPYLVQWQFILILSPAPRRTYRTRCRPTVTQCLTSFACV